MQTTNDRQNGQGNNEENKMDKNETVTTAGADVVDYGRSEQNAVEESKDQQQNPVIKETPRKEE